MKVKAKVNKSRAPTIGSDSTPMTERMSLKTTVKVREKANEIRNALECTVFNKLIKRVPPNSG